MTRIPLPVLSNLKRPPYGVRLSREEIGRMFGIHQARVWQIEKAALAKLRRHHPELVQYLEDSL